MLFGLIKKEMKVPEFFCEFPVADEKVLSGPHRRETDKYIRLTYYMKNVDNYRMKISASGYSQKSEVRYDRNDRKNYIIIERVGSKYKVAFHKSK